MPRVRVSHTTRYLYNQPVQLSQHRLMLRPQDSHDLRLLEATLSVDPPPQSSRWAHDVFGNSVCLLDWAPEERTDRLEIVSRLDLIHFPAGPSLPRATLDPAAEVFPFTYPAEEVPDVSRLMERQTPDPEHLVDAWARRFIPLEGEARTLDVLAAMTQAIHQNFIYAARETEGTQLPAETLRTGAGTCRDFALLMMEAARSLGCAARFVSGYLYDSDSIQTVGGGATHAWASVYLPGAGWVEYDPTNGLVAGTNLIRVGVTRSPAQAMPVGGGFVGTAGDFHSLIVDVAVSVGDDPSPVGPEQDDGPAEPGDIPGPDIEQVAPPGQA
ncbi:transglutaminase family protein [Humitalea sp. 24SJ18S-53]|uniref:transglutaminase family protein n=1 Tax=Humitalea sp. 24SJ18S-53 TaxID=3422307 RepID=UPI003D66EB89